MHLFGIETEYGIARNDRDESDPVVESMELVRAYLMGPFERRWDYGGEDPHEDARGFRVSGLAQDKEEDLFARLDAHRPFSFHEMKSDLVLSNGARFYNDHTHPEYSTPECRTLKQLVAHDRAGERIVQQAADRRNEQIGDTVVSLYKNNTDFHGHSYGCHDNYLVARAIKGAEVVGFADLGMEAIYEFEVKDMPVTVAVDATGESVHHTAPLVWREKIAKEKLLENV